MALEDALVLVDESGAVIRTSQGPLKNTSNNAICVLTLPNHGSRSW